MNITKSTTEEEHISAISDHITQLIKKTITANGSAVIAVSGGKSPIPLFKRLSTTVMPWDKVTIVLVDERIVSTQSMDSNENLVRTHLLQNMAQAAKFIGLMTDADILQTAHQQITKIDIAILGMGTDGHTASIFPDCAELKIALDQNNHNTYMLTNPISAKYQRVTLTLNALKSIPHLFLSLSDTEKLQIVTEAMKQENDNYPISYLLTQRPDINIYWQE